MSNSPYSITRGFPRLRSPQPPTGAKKERWLEQLRGLCHQVNCLQDCSLQSLERVTRRLEKISKTIPKAWFFKSEEQRLVENAQRVIEQLKKPNLDWDLERPVETSLGIPSFKTKTLGGIFLLSLYFQGAFGLTPQTFSGDIQTMREKEPVYREKETSGREERSAIRESTGLQRSSPPSCNYAPQETLMLRDSVRKGRLSPMEGTSSGTYVAYGTDHGKLAIVKPVNERNEGPQHKEAARRKDDLSEEDQYQLNCYRGNPAKRQFVARRLDFGSRACQPQGYIDEMDSDQFFSVEAERAGRSAGVQRKTVYTQQFVSDAAPLVEFHPDFPQDLTKAYKIEDNPILDQVPLKEFQKVALLDLLLYNEDRHPGNLLVTKDGEGKPHLIPIDMDMILPGTFQKAPWIGLFTHRRAEERLTPEALAWIQELNPEQVASVIREEGLAEPLVRQGKMLALVLKELGPDHSIAEISQFIFSKLPSLVELSRRNALKQLPPSDLESYQKGENLRKALWEKRGISSEDKTWYKAYQAESQQKIENLLEEKTFAYFKRGLQRETSIIKAQKTRHITFGTTYVAGNPDRDALSKLVSDNQQEYAQHWGLNGKVVTENLLQGQCQGLTCVPYWNKVALLKTWLEQPSSGKEEWYILADDDMPVTNMNINPYEAIDLLRKGHDASIIIARDVVQWKGGTRDHSVNTGVLIVRKDKNSKEFIEKLWAKRNDAVSGSPHCRTLGTCKTQDVLHEQEAFARVLEEDPSLLNRVVKVVNYRDRYQGQEIALNTFRRHGCFIRVQDGWMDNAFSYNDPSDGAWQEGDWMGQTAGVPIVGKECETGVSRFFRLDYLRWMLERIIPIDTDVPSSRTSQPVRASETAARGTAVSAYDQELLQQIQTTLGREYHTDTTKNCKSHCSWPYDYEKDVQQTLAKIVDPNTKLKAQQAIDKAWAKHIQTLILVQAKCIQTILGRKDHGDTTKDYWSFCSWRDHSWPDDYEQNMQHALAEIIDPDTKLKAQQAIDEAWAKNILDQKVGNEGKPYLSKIKDAAIQEKARGYIDQVLREQISSLGKQRNFEEATKRVSDIHSASVQENAKKDIADERLAYDQELLQQIQTTLGRKDHTDTTKNCKSHCSWPYDYEKDVQQTLAKIVDPNTKLKAQQAIDKAWAKHIQTLILVRAKCIQTILGRKDHGDTTKDYGSFCSWPDYYEQHMQHALAEIIDPDTKLKAQQAIGEAWIKYILDHNLEHDKDTHLAKIRDKMARSVAREGLEKRAVEKVKTLTQNKNFEEAGKVISQIQTPSIQKEAQQILDASLFGRIKHLLTKTKYNPKYDASKSSDCRGCYWPEDLEQTTEKMVSQISDTDIKEQAKKSIDQAWVQHRNKAKSDL